MNPFRHIWRNAWRRLIPGSLPLCVLLVLVTVDSIWALGPSQPMSSYIRDHFTEQDGVPGDVVDSIVQSRDGFLWLVTNSASLTRFDGRHFDVLQQTLRIRPLALAPDGDLWIGTQHDLERIPAAALNQFGGLPAVWYHPPPGESRGISSLHFTRSGVLWVGTRAGLYRLEHGAFSAAILPGIPIDRIDEASNGHLLVITSQGFVEVDGSRIVPHPELEAQLGVKTAGIYHVFEDSRGITWFCTANGVARRIGGSIEKFAPYGPKGHAAFRVYEDPSGHLWIATAEGLVRATAHGLEVAAAGMQVRTFYGDRDGNLWVGTNGDGLYRFKPRAARMFTTADGLPNNLVQTVLATHDGAVWAGLNCGGLARFDGQRFQIYKEKDGLLNSCVWALAEDLNHDLWIGTYGGGAFRFHDGHFTQYSKSQGLVGNIVAAIVVMPDGSIWLNMAPEGVSRIRDGQVRNYTKADGLAEMFSLYGDRRGDIWVGTFHGAARLSGNSFVEYSSFPKTIVFPVGEDRSGSLFFSVGSDADIYRLKNNQIVLVAPQLAISHMVEMEQGDLWLTGPGIVHLPPGGFNHPYRRDEPLDFATFGPADGLASTRASSGNPPWALTRDGKLWIATSQGLAMLDLPTLPRTDQKPSIYVRELTVGRNQQPPSHELILPAGTHHLELNFDAIELSSPEKIRFQYRLDSVDSEWLDADSSARAIYSNIPPGKHAFHVRACNRDGIWDRVGMVYYVTQQPYFYQTRWFLLSTIAFGLLVIAGLYQLRLRQVAGTLSARFEGQLAERTRIARELHDTLLQSFSALLLRLQTVVKVLPGRPEDAKQRVETAIEQASNAIAEGRDAVHQLRAGGLTTTDLAESINAFISELSSSSSDQNLPEFRVHVEGTPRSLNPMVRDETYRIATEALRNTIRYAEASKIEVEVRYDQQQLRLRIRDDGKGIDPDVLAQGHAPGHWGLRGMRERAKLLGGNFDVWSQVGSGAEVELTVPAATAYPRLASPWTIFLKRWRNYNVLQK